MIIKNFVHYPGVHCESTAIRNLLAFNGLLLSEPMIFGLGSGLSFIYWDMKKMPFPFVGTRIKQDELAKNLAENIGFDLVVEETKSVEKAWLMLKSDLSQGMPVGLKLDMFYLDYFEKPPHFAAHNVVACGFDEKTVFVVDTKFKEIQKVPIEKLKKARSSKGPFSSNNLSFKVKNVPHNIDFSQCILKTIRKNAKQMLNPQIKNLGVSGIRKFSKEILKWPERSKNPVKDFEFHYLMFEKAGSGGAGFRNLYRDFLKECSEYLDNPNIKKAHAIYSEVAPNWTKISEKIKSAPTVKNMDAILTKVSQMIAMQAEKEEEAMMYLEKI